MHHPMDCTVPAHRPAPRPRLVVVGNGMAGMRTVEEVLALAPDQYDITVFGAEPHGNYNRILLSSVLAGDKGMDDIVTHPPAWYAARGIALHVGDPVVAIDTTRRTVTSAAGMVAAWDRLILATGARPVLPPVPGLELDGVCTFRDVKDVRLMLAAAARHRRAVVIGGGVLGLEAAWGLKQRGMEVAVVHMMPSLMERQLDDAAATLLRGELERRGIASITGAQAVALHGDGQVAAVELSDGRTIAADLVVVAAGIRPDTDLARQAGLAVGRGVLVGDDMRTSHADVFAVGECVEHDGQCYGLVMPLWDMAKVCAAHLAGSGDGRRFVPPLTATKLKIPGIAVFSAGAIAAANDHDEEVIHHDPQAGIHRKLVLRHGRVIGAVLYGDTTGSGRFWQWMLDGADVTARCAQDGCRRALLECDDGAADVAALPDDAVVCHCNGVTKGTIVTAIATHGLTTLEQVSARTQAGSGCGQCSVLTARLLAQALGRDPEAEVAAVARRAARMRLSFVLWHRTNAVLMSVLLLTGLTLHFAGSPAALLGFEWSHLLHKWSGIALVGVYAAFLGLCRVFRRRYRLDADGATMFGVMPLVVVSGLAFLWPGLFPDQVFGVDAKVPVAVGHAALAVLVAMFLIHHLSHAPWVWWRKRRLYQPRGV